MISKISNDKIYLADRGWLKSKFHFSFAEYTDRKKMNFGVLRVLNDDIVNPGTGFDTHPHKDMEIITYVVDGTLTHKDSMGNNKEVKRGQVQYMSAGTGITHSEYNNHDEQLRLLQIWILPDRKRHTPNYGEKLFQWEERVEKHLHMVSPSDGGAPVQINNDANIYAGYFENQTEIKLGENRQVYLVLIEGAADINGIKAEAGEAVKSVSDDLLIKPEGSAHLLYVEMKRG